MDYAGRFIGFISNLNNVLQEKIANDETLILYMIITVTALTIVLILYNYSSHSDSLADKLKTFKKNKSFGDDKFIKDDIYYGEDSFYSILRRGGSCENDKMSMSDRSSFLNPSVRPSQRKAGFLEEDDEEELKNFLENLEEEEHELNSEFFRQSWRTEGKSSCLGRHF